MCLTVSRLHCRNGEFVGIAFYDVQVSTAVRCCNSCSSSDTSNVQTPLQHFMQLVAVCPPVQAVPLPYYTCAGHSRVG